MTIYRGVGGSGDSATGEDVFGDNSSITSLNGLSGAIQTPTYIKFAANANHTASQGELTWNTAEGTLDLGLNHGGVVLQIGQELHYRVTNQSGSNIHNGTLVVFVGTTGNSGKLLIDVYDGTQSSKAILGLTTETINNGANGYVTCFGKVRGIQTNGANYGETWLDGDILYPSPTGLTKVLPQAPAAKQPIAVVVNAHKSNGELFVRVQSGTTLAEDELVQLTALANGDVLQYNGTTGRFENVDASIVAGSISDGDKGDITVSGAGATWTIDNAVVTSTKLGGDITLAGKTLITSASAADQRTALGVVIGTNIQAYSANLDKYAAVNPTSAGLALLDDVTAADQRTTLGLGTIATQAANNVAITGGSITGITDLAIADGGTGASDAATAFANLKQAASETATGVVELATNAEVIAGTDTTRVVTPASMKAGLNATGTAPIYACRAWVNFNGTGTVAIQASGNVSSITDNGAGDYTINFTTSLPDVNYAVAGITTGRTSTNTAATVTIACASESADATLMSTTQLRVITGRTESSTLTDKALISISIFR